MESKRLIEILENAGCEVHSHSGRGMYGPFGAECVAFTVGAGDNLLAIGAEMADSVDDEGERDELLFTVRSARTDKMEMGLFTIVYFPGMEWE